MTGILPPSERYCRQFLAPRAIWNPAPPAKSPRWGFGDAARRRPEPNQRRIPVSATVNRKLTLPSAPRALLAKPVQKPTVNAQANSANTDSKQFRVIAMLRAPTGATIAGMMKATGWQQHSVRGFLTGVVRKRLKLKLTSEKVDGNRVYQIAGVVKAKPERRRSKTRSR